MHRRTLLKATLGAVGWASVAQGQGKPPVIGFLASPHPDEWQSFVTPFRQGLATAGFQEGRNVTVDYKWANGDYAKLPELADELIRRNVHVIVASGGDVAMRAARNKTSSIPIITTFGGDPVRQRLVESYNRPGTNVTGVSLLNAPLEAKRLELMQKVFLNDYVFGLLVNTNNPNAQLAIDEVEAAAQKFGVKLYVIRTSNERGLDSAFSDLVRLKVAALVVSSDPFFMTNAKILVGLSRQHSMPAIYFRREIVDAGGLMSYGTRYPDAYRQMGLMTGQILRGTKAAELPVHQPTRFELVINFKAATDLNLTMPPDLLLRADEIVEVG
jgi:putative ABC transport system substrate-binding protein